MSVIPIKIKQGTVHVTADSKKAADKQAGLLEKHLSRRYVRRQTEIERGVFALGSEAKRKLGVDVYVP